MKLEIRITDCTAAEAARIAALLAGEKTAKSKAAGEGKGEPGAGDRVPRHGDRVSGEEKKKTAPRLAKTDHKPVVGYKDGEQWEWPSMTACAKGLKITYGTVYRHIKDRAAYKGWMLAYKHEEELAKKVMQTNADSKEKPCQDPDDYGDDTRAVVGIRGKNHTEWKNIAHCAAALGAERGKVAYACSNWGRVNGWLVSFKNIDDNKIKL